MPDSVEYIPFKSSQFTWWLDELSSLSLPKLGRLNRWQILILKSQDELQFFKRKSKKPENFHSIKNLGDESELQKLSKIVKKLRLDKSQICLRLDEDQVLRKSLKIPKGALNVVEPIIINQLDRISPWSTENTLFNYVIGKSDSENGELDVEIILTNRTQVKEDLNKLHISGLTQLKPEYSSDPFSDTAIEFVSDEPSEHAVKNRSIGPGLTLLFFAALGFGAIGTNNAKSQLGNSTSLDQTIALFEERIQRVNQLQKSNIKQRADRAWLIQKKEIEPAAFLIIEALSRTIPDDTWLTGLEIQGKKILMSGSSKNATSLIESIEASPLISSARFSSATKRNTKLNTDRFSIDSTANSINVNDLIKNEKF